MKLAAGLIAVLFYVGSPALAEPTAGAAASLADPPRDPVHPARNRQLLVPSHGEEMNALFLLAAGDGPHPTLLLLHGLPGNEQNLDLAQAARRAGWNVLTLHYRGSWGSPGTFSIAGAVEDAESALAFLRRPDVAREYRIDPHRIVAGGHSMGAFAAALAGAGDIAGLLLIDAWNAGADGEAIAAAGAAGRAQAEASFDDLGHSLNGATPTTLTDELIRNGRSWNLVSQASRLAARPVQMVSATHGEAERLRPLVEAIRRHDGERRLTVVELDTDHSFADHRIALAAEVVAWLNGLRPAE